jgi:hypothetical protein
MGIRLQRSIRLGKFLRLNFSRSGAGLSAGVKGFRVGTGPRGVYINAGIPGAGLSIRSQLDHRRDEEQPSADQTTGFGVLFRLVVAVLLALVIILALGLLAISRL